MNVYRIMQTKVTTLAPDTSIRAAAALMEACDIGLLPVCQDGCTIGVVTDRDIVLRMMSRHGADSDGPVSHVMSRPVVECAATDSVAHAAALMGDHQIRRLIVRGEDGKIAGIVSVGDIARDASETIAGEALGEIVELR